MNRARFRIVVIAAFGAIGLYLAWSLFGAWAAWARALASLALVSILSLILWVPLVLWRDDRESFERWEEALQRCAFYSMGFLSFLLVLTLARDLASLVLPISLRDPRATLWILGFALGLVVLGRINAHYRVRVKTTEVKIPGLPPEFHGFRIAQISDLHAGLMIDRGFVERVVKQANAARPHLIALTGDLVDGMVRDLSAQVEPLAALEAPFGKFYVTGNHEYYWEGEPWVRKFESLGMTPLLNRCEVIRSGEAKLVVAGVPDFTAAFMGGEGPDLSKALSGAPESASKILLCHQPKIATEASQAGFHLQISGHTHGGQFFPWTLVVSWVHRFPYGLNRLGDLAVYVGRGTGFWGPPVRMGAPAEIALLVLKGA